MKFAQSLAELAQFETNERYMFCFKIQTTESD